LNYRDAPWAYRGECPPGPWLFITRRRLPPLAAEKTASAKVVLAPSLRLLGIVRFQKEEIFLTGLENPQCAAFDKREF
jgi:hypothetical protein